MESSKREISRTVQTRILILTCPATNILATLINKAAKQLEELGFGRVVLFENLVKEYSPSDRIFLVESGYEESCRDFLKEQGRQLDHHLFLKDLGLEEEAETNTENIELVKDGMVAECAVTNSPHPKFNCPCCG